MYSTLRSWSILPRCFPSSPWKSLLLIPASRAHFSRHLDSLFSNQNEDRAHYLPRSHPYSFSASGVFFSHENTRKHITYPSGERLLPDLKNYGSALVSLNQITISHRECDLVFAYVNAEAGSCLFTTTTVINYFNY